MADPMTGDPMTGDRPTFAPVAIDRSTNEAFYAIRLGRLLDIIGTSASTAAPLELLDAGCGNGRLTRALTRCGHLVDGIDPRFSPYRFRDNAAGFHVLRRIA